MIFLTIFLIFECILKNEAALDWSYEGRNGPYTWYERYPTCSARRQSPVNIRLREVKVNAYLGTITYSSYNSLHPLNMTNNGHSVVAVTEDPNDMAIARGGLNARYHFQNIYFHWGGQSEEGSEHALDGRHFPLEAHFVHKKSHGQIAIVAILFQISATHNAKLDQIIRGLSSIRKADTSVRIAPMSLDIFLPERRTYFRYQGSLTTPPCTEGVTWTVLHERIPISENQVREFRSLEDPKGRHLRKTYRPIQLLNKRRIERSKE